MKRSAWAKIIGASLLSASIAIVPLSLPVTAQTNTNPNDTVVEDNTRPTFDTTPFQETKDDNNNWGWLGLIGLIGLANLFRKPKQTTRYSEPDTATRAGSRY